MAVSSPDGRLRFGREAAQAQELNVKVGQLLNGLHEFVVLAQSLADPLPVN